MQRVHPSFSGPPNGERGIAIQPLMGFARVEPRYAPGSAIAANSQRSYNKEDLQPVALNPASHRVHSSASRSLVFTADTDRVEGPLDLVCLTWAGLGPAPYELWTVLSSREGSLVIQKSDGVKWSIKNPGFPALS